MKRIRVSILGALTSLFLTNLAFSQTTLTTSVQAPVGVTASTSQVLFTQPYCNSSGVQRGVYSLNPTTGAPSLYATLPAATTANGCTENYLAIAPGVGGFPAGTVYVTNGPSILRVTAGSTVPFTTTGAALSAPFGHSGIGFDTVGTFGYDMIFTSADGIWAIHSAGVATKLASGLGGQVYLESPSVAPLSFGTYGGWLFVTAEDESAAGGIGPKSGIYALPPGGSTLIPVALTTGQAPESISFVPSTPCSTSINGTAYQGFLTVFSQHTAGSLNPTDSAIDGFTNLSAVAGQALVTFEYSQVTPFNAGKADLEVLHTTGTLTPLLDVPTQLEGFSLAHCPVQSTTCPLTHGYWKTHYPNWPAGVFPVTIGGVVYTAADAETLMSTPVKGDANIILGMQLMAALLNVGNGAPSSPVIAQAISFLNGNNVTGKPVNLLGAAVDPNSALGQQETALASLLDAYNSSCEGGNSSQGQ